jgi:hypothetical protein
MKFLCVPCDTPMTLAQKKGPEQGSVTLVYACDACGYEMAMLTNPFETQLVSSLGVTIGPDGSKQAGASKCPFTGMIADAGAADSTAAEAARVAACAWTPAALERLEAIPSFIRPMAKSGIEQFARDRGHATIDDAVLAEARAHFGM